MSRLSSEPIQIRPTNNIYTVLAGVALLVAVGGLILIALKGSTALPGGLDWMNFSPSAK
jgi:hypothetical protein